MRRRRYVLAALTLVASLAACDSPGSPSPPPPPPPPPPTPSVTDLRIEGPATIEGCPACWAIAPGTSLQFRLIATFANGTTADVASQGTWTSDNTSVVSFAAGGLAKAGERGEVHLSARYQNLVRHGGLLVLEDGTFRLRGRVTESGQGLPDARVAVIAGTGTGLSTTTDAVGSFALYGVAGEVMLETRLDDFETGRRTVVVTEHNSSVDLELRPQIEPADLRGDWRLTVNASPGCVPAVPTDAASRTYDVTIGQTGTALQIDVHRLPLATAGFKLTGLVVVRRVTFFVPWSDYYYGSRYYAIVEMLQPGRFLGITGTARGEQRGASVTGGFDGHLALYSNEFSGGVWNQLFACQRDDHSFRLDRN
jgi:hypothetical protein